MSTVDLHVHSSISSDGEFTPAAVVEKARAHGVTMLSVTDHNSVRGVAEAVGAAGDMNLIAGTEIDCLFQGLNLHILGYGIDIGSPAFAGIERVATEQESRAFPIMLRKLRELGFVVDEEAVRNHTDAEVPVAEDIAEIMLADEACSTDARLDPYRPGGAKSDMPFVHFYYDWCAMGKPAHAEKHFPALESVIRAIVDAGGIPVLAHPGASIPDVGSTLPRIISAGIEGIEVFSSYHTEEQTDVFLAASRSHDLLITCGSDFHGKTKPRIRIGSTDTRGLDSEIIDSMLPYAFKEKP